MLERFNGRNLIFPEKLLTLVSVYSLYRFLTSANTSPTKEIICPLCRSPGPLTEHHVIPHAWGGSNHRRNKYYICRTCHDGEDKRTFGEGILSTGEKVIDIEARNDCRIKDPSKFLRETSRFYK